MAARTDRFGFAVIVISLSLLLANSSVYGNPMRIRKHGICRDRCSNFLLCPPLGMLDFHKCFAGKCAVATMTKLWKGRHTT